MNALETKPGHLLVLLTAVACGGCSFLFVRPAPAEQPPPTARLDCTGEPVLPIMDGGAAYATLYGVLALTLGDASGSGADGTGMGITLATETKVAIGAAIAALTLSAAYGLVNVDHCQSAKRTHELRQLEQAFAAPPAALGPPAGNPWLRWGPPAGQASWPTPARAWEQPRVRAPDDGGVPSDDGGTSP